MALQIVRIEYKNTEPEGYRPVMTLVGDIEEFKNACRLFGEDVVLVRSDDEMTREPKD